MKRRIIGHSTKDEPMPNYELGLLITLDIGLAILRLLLTFEGNREPVCPLMICSSNSGSQ